MTTRSTRTPVLTLSVLAVAGLVFVGVTAAEGANVINVSLPSLGETVIAAALGTFGFFGKRAFAKLEKIGQITDRIDVALRGYDGDGGALGDIRDLKAAVFHDDLVTPRGVVPPAGFNVSPAVARREPTTP